MNITEYCWEHCIPPPPQIRLFSPSCRASARGTASDPSLALHSSPCKVNEALAKMLCRLLAIPSLINEFSLIV